MQRKKRQSKLDNGQLNNEAERQESSGRVMDGEGKAGSGTEVRASRGSTRARKIIKGANKVITAIEVMILVLLLIFGLYSIWDNKRIDNENTAARYQMYKPTEKDTRGYADFRKLNPDVCGWLTLKHTGIDYPLVHCSDNDKYMNLAPDLKFALTGSLFLDYRNNSDFSDFNTIIYGHHSEGPSMFGGLDKYAKKKFFQKHKYGKIYYRGKWHRLSIFAYMTVDAYDQGIYSICDEASSAAERESYLQYIKNNAKHYRDMGAGADSHIVVMSTCMNDKTNGRYIVVGKIGKVVKGPAKQGTEKSGISPHLLNLIFALIALLIILLLIYLYLRYRQKMREGAAADMSAIGTTGTPGQANMKEDDRKSR